MEGGHEQRLMRFFLSRTTCHACETGIPHMCMGAEIGNPQPGQAPKRIQRSGGVPAIICGDTLTPLSLHEGMIEPEEMHCIFFFSPRLYQECVMSEMIIHLW